MPALPLPAHTCPAQAAGAAAQAQADQATLERNTIAVHRRAVSEHTLAIRRNMEGLTAGGSAQVEPRAPWFTGWRSGQLLKTCQIIIIADHARENKTLNRGVRLCLVLRRQDLARLREKRSARTGGASRRGSAASSAGSYSGVGASLRAPPLRAPLPRSRTVACRL